MNQPVDLEKAHLRVARPTDNLAAVLKFYRDGLGMKVLGEFQDHDGFDGVMLGLPGAAYHLEFTHKRGHVSGRAPTKENLFVFYLPDPAAWRAAVARLARAGHYAVGSFNPYWDEHGCTFEDPDGYRVVLQNRGWDNGPPPPPASLGESEFDGCLKDVVDSCIQRANKAERSGEDSYEHRQGDRPIDLILELLWHDNSGAVANFAASRVNTMDVGVRWALMRDAAEMVDRHVAPLVVHLFAAAMQELQWDGRGWLQDIPDTPSTPKDVASDMLIPILMVIDTWGEPEIRDLEPLLTCDDQAVRRAAWVALRVIDSMWHAPMVQAAVIAGLSSADSVVRSHATHIAEEPERQRERMRRLSP
jgi:catechol 2,3-dioxygenase-like lactoylglutathione lyase family enzyme